MKNRTRRSGCLLLVGFITVLLGAFAGTSAAADTSLRITRTDLGLSLLEFERALAASDLDEAAIRRVNRTFDAAVSRLFSGRNSEAIELINSITRELHPADHRSPMRDWLMSTAVEIEPRVFVTGVETETTLIIRPLYPQPPFPHRTAAVELRLIDAEGNPAWNGTLDLTDHIGNGSVNARFVLDPSFTGLPSGAYRIELAQPNGCGVRYHRLFILPRPIDEIRRELLAEINDVTDDSGRLVRAVRIARARAALLKQRPSQVSSAEFLADLHELHLDIQSEVAALQHDRDPYMMREGNLWRPVATRSIAWPMRVHAPAGLDPDQPLPLVIALHGAGGDENMFHDAYGNGVIRHLADRHRFIVASPLTYPLAGEMNLLGELIDEMQRCYPIDVNRVYLVGHSLGAGTVAAALLDMPERIAAASCIAGAGQFSREDDGQAYPPVLVIGAEHDFIIPASRVQQQAEIGMERGLPIEYRLAAHWGHVLVVGGVLEEVITWLLEHKRCAGDHPKDDGVGD